MNAFLSEFALDDLDHLINLFGSQRIKSSLQWFDRTALDDLIQINGDDFFMVALHATIGAHGHLSVLDSLFDIDPDRLTRSLQHSRGRYTGALIIFETIEVDQFRDIIRAFASALPPDVFMQSFYKDPYLLASAVRIISKRDPNGGALKEFLSCFPASRPREDLFSKDLPGLVVAFSTIQEIKAGNKVLWVKEFLDVSDEQLALLIHRKPVDLAYVLYGGYRIGIDEFKLIIESIGRQHFRIALMEYTSWLADFLTGLKKVSYLSSGADFDGIDAAKAFIMRHHPYLLQYDSYASPDWDRVLKLFDNLPAGRTFIKREDKSIQIRAYLMGLLAIYQRLLHEHMPHAMLTPTQFNLLKWQILCSTRFSEKLDNMMSNFEVGRFMVKNKHMETIILFLGHELAHQIYSICGFDAPLLSAVSIHECSADIAARCIAQRLGFVTGMSEYEQNIIQEDDFSEDNSIRESDLIAQGIPHIIGRTQLGHIIQGFKNNAIDIDWEILFPVTLAVLRNKTKMRYVSYVRSLVAGYTYCSANGIVSDNALHRFIGICENSFVSTSSDDQMADVNAIEEMIIVAQALLLRSATPSLPWGPTARI